MRKKLIDYGYYWLGMEEEDYESAIKDFKKIDIYKLYEDNTESLAESIEDIKNHYANGGLFGVETKRYDNYVVFLLGRDLLKGILPLENDIAYEWCVNIAKDFEVSEYNINTKGLYSCLEDYIKARFYINNNRDMSFMGIDLYKIFGEGR